MKFGSHKDTKMLRLRRSRALIAALRMPLASSGQAGLRPKSGIFVSSCEPDQRKVAV